MLKLASVITCPVCGFKKKETMPVDACVHFYECAMCGNMLKPKPGDCCVFCSYGSVPCPVKQKPQSTFRRGPGPVSGRTG